MRDFEPPKRRRKRNPDVITAKEAAEIMKLHPNSILWNIRQDYLKADFDGYKYLIKLRDLREFRETYYE